MKKLFITMVIAYVFLYSKTLFYNNDFIKYNNDSYIITNNEYKLNYIYTYFNNKTGMHCIRTNIINNYCDELY